MEYETLSALLNRFEPLVIAFSLAVAFTVGYFAFLRFQDRETTAEAHKDATEADKNTAEATAQLAAALKLSTETNQALQRNNTGLTVLLGEVRKELDTERYKRASFEARLTAQTDELKRFRQVALETSTAQTQLLAAAQGQIAALERTVQQQGAQLATLEHTIAEKDTAIQALRRALEEKDQALQKLEHDLRTEQTHYHVLNDRVQTLEAENERLKTERDSLVAERSKLEAEVAQLRAEVDEIKRKGTGPLVSRTANRMEDDPCQEPESSEKLSNEENESNATQP